MTAPYRDPIDSRLSHQLQFEDWLHERSRFTTLDDSAVVAEQVAARKADRSFRFQGILAGLEMVMRDFAHQVRIAELTEEQRAWCNRFEADVRKLAAECEAFWKTQVTA